MRPFSSRLWALALLSAALQILCFPIAGPIPAWRAALSWIALSPLLAVLLPERDADQLTSWRVALLAYLTGALWYLGNCYWIYPTMHVYGGIAPPAAFGILLLFCLYLGLYHALFGGVLTLLRRSAGRRIALLASPFLWVAVELARARITGFPWDLLGMAQVDNPLLIRLAPFTGAYGLSFVVAAVNALWLARITLRERRYTRVLLTCGGVLTVVLYLIFVARLQRPAETGPIGVATLLQENLSVGEEAIAHPTPPKSVMLEEFSRLSLFPPREVCHGIPELASTRCDGTPPGQGGDEDVFARTGLIVWPEAPNDFYERDPEFRDALSRLARAAKAPIIVGDFGADAASGGYLTYNSASLVEPDGAFAARYDKMHLVPFGEYVPFRRLFFFAGSLLDGVGQLTPGRSRTVFVAGAHTIGVFICYESIFGDEVRQLEQRGAQVLVNISDDGWYGDSSAPWEHLAMVRMRAIENRRWVLRATNTGVTAVIDPWGRVTAAAPRHQRTSLYAVFHYEQGETFYAAHGDLFAWLCVAVSAVAAAFGAWRSGSLRNSA